ncbi:MAG: TIGR02391 family protein [Proteobacteria bacterium]|nr:TIGR02391 family protein [Pseudomonadota bacterium]
MPKLIELLPDPQVLCALEPDELGLRMLPVLATWHNQHMTQLSLASVLEAWIGGRYPGEYDGRHQVWVEGAVREAWAWLVGAGLLLATTEFQDANGLVGLSRRARQLAQEPDARKVFAARRIAKETLHPSIREDVWALYHRAKYSTAVFEAMREVEVAVREAANMPDTLLGVKLMRAAFAPSPNAGKLTDTETDGGEQVARMELFAGAIGSYKNPHSHHKRPLDDPDEVAEIIMLSNHLLRIVDSRRANGDDQ